MEELSALFNVADFNNDGSVDKYELVRPIGCCVVPRGAAAWCRCVVPLRGAAAWCRCVVLLSGLLLFVPLRVLLPVSNASTTCNNRNCCLSACMVSGARTL